MKLYSKQTVLIIVLSVALIMLLGGTFIFKIANFKDSTINPIQNNDYELAQLQQQIDDLQNQILAMQGASTQDELQNITVYENAKDAVVHINTQVLGVNWFLQAIPKEGGSGSGAIIDSRGYVVTNVHVIEDAYKIYISLADGTQYEGTVVGTDLASDIAVLKFNPPAGTKLTTIDYADSDSLVVGQKVIAIGNPFGFERTLTTGVISALGRPIQTSNDTIIRDMVQTDTAINPGNSGGPLLDTQGRLIGVNTIIYSTSGASAGVGFAVPVNTAKRVVSDLIEYGMVQRGVLDKNAQLVQVTNSIAEYAGLSVNTGLLVSELSKNVNAEQAGLQAGTKGVRYGSSYNSVIIYLGGDVITSIDGSPVTTFADYYSLLEDKRPGDTAVFGVQRGRNQLEVSIELEAE